MPLWDRERKRSLKTMNEQDHAKLKRAFEYYRTLPKGPHGKIKRGRSKNVRRVHESNRRISPE
jgi:hypothetical protein